MKRILVAPVAGTFGLSLALLVALSGTVTFPISVIACISAVILSCQLLLILKEIVRSKEEINASNIKLDAIINNVDEGIIVCDDKGIIEEFNQKASDIFGYTRDEMIYHNIFKLFPPHLKSKYEKDITLYKETKHSLIIDKGAKEVIGIHQSGRHIPLDLALTDMMVGSKNFFVSVMNDITARKITEAKLKESEAKFRSAFNSSAISMAIISIDGVFIQVNYALCNLLGYEENELLNSNFQSIIISQDLKSALQKRDDLLNNAIQSFKSEERYHHKNGGILWLLLTYSLIRSEQQEPLYFIVQIQDITAQKKSEEHLAYQAYYDSLTGLPNRAQLEHSIEKLINHAKRHHLKFAVFFLDLDKFKHINDTFGHHAGDKLLITIGERLSSAVRKTDIVARLSGDEFILVLTDVTHFETVANFAEKLISILTHPVKIKENDFFITTSIGISIYPADGKDYQTLIKNADIALYKAKEQGRNNYQFCTVEMGQSIKEKFLLENALKAAIIKDEFNLHYQPQVDAGHENIVGIEAFVRWSSKEYGAVSPQTLLPIAEETGLILPLTEWIIKTAFSQIQQLNKAGFTHINIAINLSARQFMCDQLSTWIEEGLKDANISPTAVKLEVKEGLLLQIPENVLTKLTQLRAQGIQIILDDFGTGYSSLSYLQNDMVDYIKIDDSLTQSIQSSKKNRSMVIAIINLAKNLGIKVIAEGVETAEQYQFLIKHKCDILQGYYISKPLNQADLLQFLQTHTELATSNTDSGSIA